MPRLNHVDPATATGRAAELFKTVKATFGLVPNMTKGMAAGPAALDGFLSFGAALGKGGLDAKTRELIAVAVADANGCDYCLSAHGAIAKMLGASPADIEGVRDGDVSDAKAAGAIRLAQRVVTTRGNVTEDDLGAARRAGLSDGDIAEVVANVAINVFTNYFNNLNQTPVDFPKVKARAIG